MMREEAMIAVHTNDLSKHYQMGEVTVEALNAISLTVNQGEFLAVMGPSGSGKSTLLHLLGGLDAASSGNVTLAGVSLAHLDDDALTQVRRHQVGFVFQAYNLLPTLSAAENIALPLLIAGHSPDHNRLHELLELVDLADRRQHKPAQLSGGQQQRVAIARALIHDPPIVLADEPTGNLDSHAGQRVLALLRRMTTELDKTVVMVTHDARAAAQADRVIFLKDGRIVRHHQNSVDDDPLQKITAIMAELAV
ncbi:MAG: ABC transporter ATP-binding protein [Candidatus Promineifilaceae bacterium]|nr:ABC transporter ATP-binding protein [Candidatus Promineifilaceae bacterium]